MLQKQGHPSGALITDRNKYKPGNKPETLDIKAALTKKIRFPNYR